jgi:hypothetical protein
VKNAYLADALGSWEHTPSLDLEKPFTVTFTTKGKRGSTDYENAIVAIRVEDLFVGLPKYFRSDDKDDHGSDQDDEDVKEEKPKRRTLDWLIGPYVHEWDYRIVAPNGYKVRALPPAKEELLGTAKLTQSYTAEEDGRVVKAVLRFESGKTRLTVDEGRALREAVNKAKSAEPIYISFDLAGHKLIAEGKIREGLEAYQQLVNTSPKSALRRVQLARALLTVGLGEKARAVAREATNVEPASYQAFFTLGWVLERDLIGRRFKKGFDHEGAVAAYRKAKELAPKEKNVRASLAILLESDATGDRYTPKSRMKEAITEYTELKKMDEDYFKTYEDNIPFDLWYLRDFKGVAETVAGLPPTDVRRSLVLASVAATVGAEAAIERSLQVATQDAARNKAMISAGWLLARVGKYSEAADLFAAGSKGQSSDGPSAAFVAALKKAKPRNEFKFDDTQPASALLRLYATMFRANVSWADAKELLSANATRGEDSSHDAQVASAEAFHHEMYALRQQVENNGVSIQVIGDAVLSNARIAAEGTDANGYRLTVNSPGAAPQKAFVVREGGTYKIVAGGGGGSQAIEAIGWEALGALSKGDAKAARQWLDWVREEIHISGSDDPLQANPFPYFWTKGQEADEDAIKTASLVLLPSKFLKSDDIATLLQLREKAKRDDLKARLDQVIASAYQAQAKWPELAAIAERLLQAFPDSNTALRLVTDAYANSKRLNDWEKLIQSRMAKRADDPDNIRTASALAVAKGDYANARELLKKLIDRGTATQSDLNFYAWNALFLPGTPGADSIEAAERANDMAKNADLSIMHTLACVYARSGKGAQAKTFLLKSMDLEHMEEPNSAIWLAYGNIAEDFGENDAAAAMYARVENPKSNVQGSNYELAQVRLSLLHKPKTSASANGTH